MADEEIEYIDATTGSPVSASELGNYDTSPSQEEDSLDFEELEFIDGNTGQPISSDQIDRYDLETAQEYKEPSPPISNEPGWGETITTNIGTGAANLIGGLGSLIDMIPVPGPGIGKGLQAEAAPFQIGGMGFNKKIPKDSWQETVANITKGVSGTAPTFLLPGKLPQFLATQLFNTFGQTANQKEMELTPSVGPEAAREMSRKIGAIDALGQMPWNALGAAPVFNQTLPLFQRMAVSGLSNAAMNPLGTATSMYAPYLAGATPEAPTWEEITKAGKESMLEGFILGNVMAGTQVGKERIADIQSNRALRGQMADMRARIDAYNEANGIKLLPAPEGGGQQPLGLPSPDDPNVVYAGEPSEGLPHQSLGDLSNPPIPRYQTEEQPFDKYRGSDKVKIFKPGMAQDERIIDFAGNAVDKQKSYYDIPILKSEKPVKSGKIILEDVIGQGARDDFYQAQLRGEPVSRDLEIIPPSNIIQMAKETHEASPAGKLEAEAKTIVETVPQRQQELQALQQKQVELAQADPVIAEQIGQEINAKTLELEGIKKRAEQIQQELDPAPVNSDPVVAREQLVDAPETIFQDPENPSLPTLDNSSNVFPEGISKPNSTSEDYAAQVTRQTKLNLLEGQKSHLTHLDEMIRSRQNIIDGYKSITKTRVQKGKDATEIIEKIKIEEAALQNLRDQKRDAAKESEAVLSTRTLEETPSGPSSKKNNVRNLKSRVKSERGALDIGDIFSYTTDGLKKLLSRGKDKGFRDNPEYYKFFASKWKNPLTAQITKADRFPWYRKSHESSVKHFEDEHSIAYDHAEKLRPYTLLNNKERMEADAFLYEANRRGPELDTSPANLKKLGFSDRVIRGVSAVRDTLNNALDMLKQEALTELEGDTKLTPEAKQAKLIEINNKFDVARVSNYAPQGRSGKFGLTLYDNQGNMVKHIMDDSKGKLLNRRLRELVKDPNLSAERSVVKPIVKPLKTEFVGAHPDIIDMLDNVEGSNVPQSSFLNHLKKRKDIEGYDLDLARNLASYLSSHARYVSTQRLKREYSKHNKEFEAFYETLGDRDQALYSGLKGEIENLQGYMLNHSESWTKTRKFLGNFYLPMNPKTLITNLTSFVTTWPNVARYMSGFDNVTLQPEFLLLKTTKDVGKYYAGKPLREKDISNPNDSVIASIDLARKEGAIGGSRVVKDMLRDSNSPTPTGPLSSVSQKISSQDAMFFMNSMVEDFTKTHSHALGWHLWEKAKPYFERNKIPMPSRHEFAKRFANETQGDYRKTGSPNIIRGGLGKLAGVFRLYQHGFFTTLKKSVFNNKMQIGDTIFTAPNVGAVTRFLTVLGALGGVAGLPVISTILKGAKLAGFDPDKKIEEGIEKIGDLLSGVSPELAAYLKSPQGKSLILNGAEPFGVSMAGSADTSFLPPGSSSGDPVGMAARVGLGVITDIPDRLSKAKFFFDKGEYGRMSEHLLPRAFAANSIAKAMRWNKEGMTDSHGRPMMDRPLTTDELVKTAMGFSPSAVTRAYNQRTKENKILEEQDKGDLYERMAHARIDNDTETWQALTQEALKKGALPSSYIPAVIEHVKRIKSYRYNQLKRMGKKNMSKVEELNALNE